MSIHIRIEPRTLHFREPAGTSRGVYTTRKSWYVHISSDEQPGYEGIGECAPLPDLSCDATPEYERTLEAVCRQVELTGSLNYQMLRPYPSILFGLETAFLALERRSDVLFDTPFGNGAEGIPINGLVWMGSFDEMMERLETKMKQGFHCVKLKIGAIDFNRELQLIRHIREAFSPQQIELRVDANGGFDYEDAFERLDQLAPFGIHSIEQPIRQRQWTKMAMLCRHSPIPIALDEELIGVNMPMMKAELLDTIHPAYIVLKPSLHGGMHGTEEWIQLARERGIGSWITSALESNVGLNAIAHFTAHIYGPGITFPQGLGTGQLFTDNIPMPLHIKADRLWYEL